MQVSLCVVTGRNLFHLFCFEFGFYLIFSGGGRDFVFGVVLVFGFFNCLGFVLTYLSYGLS